MKSSISITATAFALAYLYLPHLARAEMPAPQALGACVWAHIADTDKSEIAATYHTASTANIGTHMRDFTKLLDTKDTALLQAFGQCDVTPNVPKPWIRAFVGALSIQYGASSELLTSRQITRSDLDDAWAQAPNETRACVTANAAKVFGLKDRTCADNKAPTWYLTHFDLDQSAPSDHNDAVQVLIYMNAKAQEEWAAYLIGRFDKDALAKKAS